MAGGTPQPQRVLMTEQENSTFGGFIDLTGGKILLLIRSHKESRIAFQTILSIAIPLIVLGVVVNGAISFVMLRGKRYKKNTSNVFILYLSVTKVVFRFVVFPLVICFLFPRSELKHIHCKAIKFFCITFASATLLLTDTKTSSIR